MEGSPRVHPWHMGSVVLLASSQCTVPFRISNSAFIDINGTEVRCGLCHLFAVDNRVPIGNRRQPRVQMRTRRVFIASERIAFTGSISEKYRDLTDRIDLRGRDGIRQSWLDRP